jgi:GTPase KRas protein
MMLVGNKSDKTNEREVSREDGIAMARRLGCDFVEASAKTSINVEKAFYQVVRLIRASRGDSPKNVKSTKSDKKKGKCLVL